MKLRPRLVPALIVAATVLLGIKVSDIVSIGADRALAQAPSGAKPATAAPVSLTKAANAAANPAASPAAANPTSSDATADPAPSGVAAAPAPGATPPATDTASAPASTQDPLSLSPAEFKVLQELSQRRAELDKRASDLDQQQVVLEAAEKRVDEKIAKLQDLQKSIQTTVDKENAADDARMQSLVKIYSAMKPADAAQIISQLDLRVALQMLSQMKEAKTAPILAAMDPPKAEAITAAMAQKQAQTVAPAASAATAQPGS